MTETSKERKKNKSTLQSDNNNQEIEKFMGKTKFDLPI